MLKIILPITATIGTAAIVALILLNRPQGDAPTAATSDENLQQQVLPAGLAKLEFEPPRSDSANTSFDKLLEQAQAASRFIGQGGFAAESRAEAGKVCNVMKSLAQSMPLEKGFADQHIGPRDLNDPDMKQQLTIALSSLKLHVDQLIEARQYDAAAEAAGAYFVVGHNMFEHNTHLRPRQAGLMMMRIALTTWMRALRSQQESGGLSAADHDKTKAAAQPWFDAIREIETAWDIKLKSIDIPDPNVGDLIRVAEKDQDLSFRVFAVRRLGLARFEHGDSSNTEAIEKAIASAKSSSDPMIRSSAETAEKLTIEQFRQATR